VRKPMLWPANWPVPVAAGEALSRVLESPGWRYSPLKGVKSEVGSLVAAVDPIPPAGTRQARSARGCELWWIWCNSVLGKTVGQFKPVVGVGVAVDVMPRASPAPWARADCWPEGKAVRPTRLLASAAEGETLPSSVNQKQRRRLSLVQHLWPIIDVLAWRVRPETSSGQAVCSCEGTSSQARTAPACKRLAGAAWAEGVGAWGWAEPIFQTRLVDCGSGFRSQGLNSERDQQAWALHRVGRWWQRTARHW